MFTGSSGRLFTTTFTDKASLKTALQAYDTDPTAAIATHGPIADLDVSAITDMEDLFVSLPNFNADISKWDTSKVTTMDSMFKGASAFNQPLSFDTSSVTNMERMFQVRSARALAPAALSRALPVHAGCVATTQRPHASRPAPPPASHGRLSTRQGATAFNQPLSFDTSKVTNMGYMFFEGATAFNQPLSFDTSKVTNMGYMFYSAAAFNQPLSFDTSKVTNMGYMFHVRYPTP